MAIVIAKNSPINQEAANYFKGQQQVYLKQINEINKTELNKLIIIDLEANGKFQDAISPRILVERLKESEAISFIHQVELLVSNVDINNHLITYASSLANYFSLLGNQNIKVFAPIGYGRATFIEPPTPAINLWRVYNFAFDKLANIQLSFAEIRSIKDKELLWEGRDIEHWLCQPQNCFTATPLGIKNLKQQESL